MSEIIYWLINMSIAGAITGMAVLIIRRIRALPKRIAYVLWAVPLLRLWLPFGLDTKYSLMNILDDAAVKTVPVYEMPDMPMIKFSTANSIQQAESYFPLQYKTNVLEGIFTCAGVIWLSVLILLLLFFAYVYIDAMRRRDNSVPYVAGVIRPKVILPDVLSEEDKRYVLLHEMVHVKRGDNFWRIIALITCAIHWFNPFVWIFLKRFYEDLELACDEKVIKDLNDKERLCYANALLNCEEVRGAFVSGFGGAKTKRRIERIINYKSLTLFSAAAFIALAIAVAVTLLTNRM